MASGSWGLAEVAQQIGAELQGDPEQRVSDIAPLDRASTTEIAFFKGGGYLSRLEKTAAAAVILSPDQAQNYAGNRLLMADPYLGYARAAALFHPYRLERRGVDPTAVVDATAVVATDAWVGPGSVVMAGVEIGSGVEIGPGCWVAEGCRIGTGSRLLGRVSMLAGTVVGEECIIHPGAVLGSDGFGFANDAGRWVKIPQLGRVVIGDRVEIGANTTIDRGALEDTVIADGVKLDNLIHIAHNVQVGADCAMAAMVGVAGSTRIGSGVRCAGQVGISGHLEIAAGSHFTARTLVTHSIQHPGTYSSGTTVDENVRWRRNSVQFKRLNDSMKHLRALEKRLKQLEVEAQGRQECEQ